MRLPGNNNVIVCSLHFLYHFVEKNETRMCILVHSGKVLS